MKRTERYERADRLFSDVELIRDKFIPSAISEKRWNVVIFEAYRVAELTVKAMIFCAGYTPSESHNLDKLISDLNKYLQKANWSYSFIYFLSDSHGNGYGLEIAEGGFSIVKHVAGRITNLGSCQLPSLGPDIALHLSIEQNGSSLRVMKGDQEIISLFDTAVAGPIRVSRALVKPSDNTIIAKIQEYMARLLAYRTEAFYSERAFSESEAMQAVNNMSVANDLCKVFYIRERV